MTRSEEITTQKPSRTTACAIFAATLLIFSASPIHHMGDSKYSMLVSYSVMKRGTFALDGYGLPRPVVGQQPGFATAGESYQLEVVNGRLFYWFPPGSSILSIPFVAVLELVGMSPVNPDGTYNRVGEILIQVSIAGFLMAGFAALLFLMSRLILPPWWSVLIALSGVLGTQVWSTASRGLWSHTWGVVLVGCVVLMLLAQEKREQPLNPMLAATLLAWSYFVRPTNIVSMITISLYILIFRRSLFIRYAVTAAVWLVAFMVYSWHNFSQLFPTYFRGALLGFGLFWTAVAGNLVSPSRGLFVFVPVLAFLAYLLARYRTSLPFPRLVVLALTTAIGHLLLISTLIAWWAGHSYGPRYFTDMVPWFALLGILGVRAMLDLRDRAGTQSGPFGFRIELAVAGILLSLSVLIHAHGAFSHAARMWNVVPVDVDQQPVRVWDWRRPQFLAGLLPLQPP